MKNKTHRQVFLILSIMSLCSFVAFMGVSGTSADLRRDSAARSFLKTSQEVNSSLNENILRARTFLLENYDPIVADVDRMTGLCNAMLAPGSEIMRSNDPMVIASLRTHCDLAKRKILSIEQFKSTNSILKNSVRYLPILIENLRKNGFQNLPPDLLIETFKYNSSPEESRKRDVVEILEKIKSIKPMNREGRQLVESLERHLAILFHATGERRALERDILGNDMIESQAHLQQVYDRWHDQQEGRAAVYHIALFILAGLLGAILLVIFVKLQRASLQLAVANATLESRVALRTDELSNAMTQLAENQSLIMHSAKMSALGEMAGGIAHEINTPLAAIMMTAEILSESAQLEGQSASAEGFQSIMKIVEKISRIIQGLRRFSRDSSREDAKAVPVSDILTDTMCLCQEKLKAHEIRIRISDYPVDLSALCVGEQITQVLLNLFNNSLDAVDNMAVRGKWIRVDVLPLKDFVEISVTDGGLGIPEHVRQKLMQPFFTTKGVGKGTGLGLSISKGIVEHHGGRFFYDQASKNTRFVLHLPRAIAIANAA